MRVRSSLALSLVVIHAGCAGFLVVEERPDEPAPVEATHRGSARPATLGIPPGHLPPPGECRVWFPGRPPGHQPPPTSCAVAERDAPPGAWVLYRPKRERVQVSVHHESRPRVVIAVRFYDALNGEFLYERESPE